MANPIELLEKEAVDFMAKRLKVEQNIALELQNELISLEKNINNIFLGYSYVNLFNIGNIFENEIRLILNQSLLNQLEIVNNAIVNHYGVGIEQAEKFLKLVDEKPSPMIKKDFQNDEIVLALLLYGRKLISSLNSDLVNNLEKNLTSIYITSKRQDDSPFNRKSRDTEKDSTFNTVLSGAVITKYINGTFDNITRRAEVIARTETNRALNHGMLGLYISSFYDGKIESPLVKWVEIPDRRLCQRCREMANEGEFGIGVYHIGEVNPPPLHVNCRCVLVPFNKKWL